MTSSRRRHPSRGLSGGIGLALLAAGLLVGPVPHALAIPGTTPAPTYVTDGRVNSVVAVGTRIFLAGSFTMVGPDTGLAGIVDPTTATTTNSWALGGGSVLAAASDGAGGWFIGGLFTVPSGIRQANAAHVLADGSLDETWNPRPNNTVRSIVYDAASHTVYLGGDFTNVHSVSDLYAAAVDDSTGAAVLGFALSPDEPVRALASDGAGHLYLGGDFDEVDGTPRSHLAAVSMTTGTLSSLPTPAANATVQALARSAAGDQMYVGGIFTTLGGVARPDLGAVATATGTVTTAFAPGPSGAVDALLATADGSGLYVGGAFGTIGGSSSPLLARLSPTTGARDTAFAPGFASTCTPANPDTTCTPAVRSLAFGASGSTIEVGGAFLSVRGVGRPNAAELGSDGTPTAWNPVANGPVDAIGAGSGGVLVGGELTSLNAVARQNLAALSRASGALDPTWHPGTDAQVRTIVASPDGTTLYIGGDFATVGGIGRTRVAKLSALTGAVDPAFHPVTSKSVYALGLNGTRLFVGGSFSSLAGMSTHYLGLVSPTTGAGVTTFLPAPNAMVESLGFTSSGATLWVGGEFTNIGGRNVFGLAGVSTTTGKAATWTPSPHVSRVMAIAAAPGTVCVGTRSNQTSCYDSGNGASKLFVKSDGNVQAVAIAGTTVYAGGHFNVIHLSTGDVTRRKLAAYSLIDGSIQAWAPTVNSALGVFALAPTTEGLYVGGDFTEITGAAQQGIALLPGSP